VSEPLTYPAPVLRDERTRMHYVPVPPEIADALGGAVRVVATVGDHTSRRAIQHRGGGGFMLVVGLTVLREAGLAYGDTALVTLAPDPDPDRIDLGELADALAADDEARARWETFTPGRQRSMAYYVTSAKRPETRAARAREIAHKLATHTLWGDRRQGA